MTPPSRYPSDQAIDASPLGQPLHFTFSERSAPNRFMKAAMAERLASWSASGPPSAQGIPSEGLINAYRRWGEGGFGMILTGHIMVDGSQVEAAGDSIVPRDAVAAPGEPRFDAFRALASGAKQHGALIVGQLNHPGARASAAINPDVISASDVGEGKGQARPRAATDEDIAGVVAAFAHAARYLEAAGFDGVELHGAHGYLLAQFLSPATNKRADGYGGPAIEDRARIVLEVGEAVRAATGPGFVLGIKLNSVDFQAGGFTTEDACALAALLERRRFDFVELSGGGEDKNTVFSSERRASTKRREAFFLEFAERITPALKATRAFVTGGLRTAAAMVEALQAVDGVGLGRPAAQEPRLPNDILSGKVDAAIMQRLDPQDFATALVAAGSLIRQIAKDKEPIDLSQQRNVDAFLKAVQRAKEQPNDGTGGWVGFVDVDDVELLPYGTLAP